MDGEAMASIVAAMFWGAIAITVAVTATVCLGISGVVFWFMVPSPEQIEKAKARKAVIDTLTPEQLEALGIKAQ